MSRATSGPAARRLCALALAVLLAGTTLASYAPTFSAGFVDIDDADYVPENAMVEAGLSRDGVVWAFRGVHAGNWIPLTWLSHMTDVALFGVEPAGHHAMNVALHVANAVLLFALLVSLTGALTPSFLVAGVFALHPINVESVAWISQRKTTLATFFAILAIGSYARWARRGSRLAYAGSLLAFALSLLAKQMFVPLPFALLLLDYWPLRRPDFDPAAGALPEPAIARARRAAALAREGALSAAGVGRERRNVGRAGRGDGDGCDVPARGSTRQRGDRSAALSGLAVRADEARGLTTRSTRTTSRCRSSRAAPCWGSRSALPRSGSGADTVRCWWAGSGSSAC